jgi:hypothetical protein
MTGTDLKRVTGRFMTSYRLCGLASGQADIF